QSTQTLTADRIRIAFTNDALVNGTQDRNLHVDKIILDGVVHQTESPTVFSTGTWLPADGIQPGYRLSQTLHGNGYFQYATGPGSLVEIYAAGKTGLENMSLVINQATANEWKAIGGDALAAQYGRFAYRAPVRVTADQVQLWFTNDVYEPPVDYDLRIDRIVIDGVTYQTEADTTYSTGTYVPANGLVLPGFWQLEWLNSNGYVEYLSPMRRPGSIGLASSVIAAREGSPKVDIAIVRSSGSDGTVSIDYKLNSGTAIAGRDFQAVGGTIVFGPGEVRKLVSVPILNDATIESPESFSLVIENPSGGARLLAPRTATITITDDDLLLPDYDDFATTQGMRINGNASAAFSTIQLTNNLPNRRGSAFYTTSVPIQADSSFQSFFQFRTTPVTTGGDGFAFVVHNDSRGATALGTGGAGLGYAGIQNSLAIAFDTIRKPSDLSENHLSIYRNGEVSAPLATMNINQDFNTGSPNYAWVEYNGDSDTLSVYISSTTTKPATPTLTTEVALRDQTGSRAFFGFTAATSGLHQAHRLYSWQLNFERPAPLPGNAPPTALVNEPLVTGLSLPTALAFDPSGRTLYVAEKQGRVVAIRDGVTQTLPFIDLSDEVNSMSDRGLLDIKLHPNFPSTPYVYLLYTYDPPEVFQHVSDALAGPDGVGNRAGRLVRVTADVNNDYLRAVSGSQVVLLGTNSTWNNFNAFVNSTIDIDEPEGGIDANGNYIADFINSDSESHSVAGLAFAPDGSLLVAIGDGASYNTVDPRAVRVQSVDSLSGKVLRINPLNGRGYADNPFYNGDPTSNRSKVYQLGLRNPFRFTVNPANGQIWIGEVGWTQWEEINTGPAGANFGWPYYEGSSGANARTISYQDLPQAQAFYASGQIAIPSVYAFNHAADGMNAIIMGQYYTGNAYPAEYQSSIFFNDLEQGIVRVASASVDGQLTNVRVFATGANYVVQLSQGPDGNLYYVDLDDGVIGRWKYVQSNDSPDLLLAQAQTEPTAISMAMSAPVMASLAWSWPTATDAPNATQPSWQTIITPEPVASPLALPGSSVHGTGVMLPAAKATIHSETDKLKIQSSTIPSAGVKIEALQADNVFEQVPDWL
ncbi:MAG: PQQ-dependent sugar dehydrogenase, partial [Pirellulaceae bacterium]|nr:PQQ-dependent sugar dehydrogenase [Pirellulaceae bacterium]